MRTIIIAGSRDFSDRELMTKTLDSLITDKKDIKIIHGDARGADKMAGEYAKVNNIPYEAYPADWDKYKKAAGPIRNREMSKVGNELVAFWDGISPGTKNMINVMEKKKAKVTTVIYKREEE